MLHLLSDAMRRDPYAMYAQMRSASPLLHVPSPELWMVFDYEGVKRTLHDHDAFSSRVIPAGGKAPDWLIFQDPPLHTELRAILLRAFTPRSIATLELRVRALSSELLDQALPRGEMDLCADYAGPLPTLVIADLLGIPAPDRTRLMRWSEVIMNLSYSIAGGEEAARATREHAVVKQEISAYLPDLLAERQRAPQEDLLTRLVEAEVDGVKLAVDEIVGFFQLLLGAGTETTTNLINNAILCLLEHPTELARLRAAPLLLPSAIEEVLRYRSPAQMMARMTKRDIEMHGQVIPAGKFVLAMIGSANRDPRHFDDADRFDIGRDPNPHIAFGHGIHFCLGATLARLEAKVALSDLLERAPDLSLASDAPWEPRKSLLVHGPARLPVRFKPTARPAPPG